MIQSRIEHLRQNWEGESYAQLFGMRLMELKDGHCVIECLVKPGLTISEKVVPREGGEPLALAQGMVAASIANYAGVYAVMTLTKRHAALRASSGTHPRPIFEGDVIWAEANVVDSDADKFRVEVKVFSSRGAKLKAQFSLIYARPKE